MDKTQKLKICKTAYLLTFIVLLLALLLQTALKSAYAEAPVTERVVRLGVTDSPGISQKDKYGNYGGLAIDYLNEIAKYTNWKIEYVNTDSGLFIEDLQEGKFDLMGGVYYSSGLEEYFGYPEYSMGHSRVILLCRNDDNRLRSYDLTSMEGKVIGVFDKSEEKIRRLKEYLSLNDISCTLKYYTSEDMSDEENLYRFLINGDVDMLMGNELDIHEEFRVVASFDAQPYYMVTRAGDTELLEELNAALKKISEVSPGFALEKYEKNFPSVITTDIPFNEEEDAYIKEKKTVKVSMVRNWHPFVCAVDSNEEHDGFLTEFLEEIGTYTGLTFEYMFADTYNEAVQFVKEGQADILGFYFGSDEEAFSDGMVLTTPYTSLNSIIVKNKSSSYPADGLTGGIVEGKHMPDDISAENVKYYTTTREGLEAVNKGEIDFFYGVSAHLEREMQKHRYVNISPVTRINNDTQFAFALERPADSELLGILNKAIGSFSKEDINTILDRNLVSIGYTDVPVSDLIYANPIAFIAIAGIIILLIALILIFVTRSKMKQSLILAELEKAEAKSMAKSEFLSQMSHEIRTPMTAIIGLTDLTCMNQQIPPAIMENLQKIRSSSKYLLSLINDILDMSRIEKGKLEIDPEDFSMNELLDEVEKMIAVQAEQKGISYHVRRMVQHDKLCGDSVRIRQVLLNLLSNAIKFTPSGGKIILQAEERICDDESAEYHFSVTDTGIGIARESQDIIFRSFEQLGRNVTKSEGTGLGLAISSNIVEAMGGVLEVESRPGEGARFYFAIRLALGNEQGNSDTETANSFDMNGIRVLLAEDNDLNAQIVTDLLELEGAEIIRARNGAEAVDKFNDSAPGWYNVILMDILMPEKNGLEATREIRAGSHPDCKRIPIIAMTANTFKEDEKTAMDAGMTAFVPKPVDLQYMFKVLKDNLSE